MSGNATQYVPELTSGGVEFPLEGEFQSALDETVEWDLLMGGEAGNAE